MIHEIAPKIFYNSYRQETPDAKSSMMIIKDNAVLAKEAQTGIAFPSFGEANIPADTLTYLFSIDDQKFFLAPAVNPWGGYDYIERMAFRNKKPKHLVFAAAAACQLSNWYENNRFCGRCGAQTAHGDIERMLRCDACGNMIYPKISPAVIVAVTDGDRLLMTSGAGKKPQALIAGFAETGEPAEDTVRREVFEETGIRVKNIRFYKTQPWPFSETLLMGFYCDLDGPDTIVLDTNELENAEWVRREDIGVEFNDLSLTNEMIIRFKENKWI